MIAQRLLWGLLLAVPGCSSHPVQDFVTIDDISGGAKSGYYIVQVDGREVRRLEGRFVTYVPFALVEPGAHCLGLVRRQGFLIHKRRPEYLVLHVDVELGKSYRLHWNGEGVELVEE